jgi:hypothetical protein
MKNVLYAAIALLVGMSTFVFASSRMHSIRNEYGGESIISEYFVGDDTYIKGIAKLILNFDSNKKQISEERIYTNEYAQYFGASKSITYFSGDQKLEKRIRTELIYSDESSKNDGIAKEIAYYSNKKNNKLMKSEIIYTEQYMLKNGIAKDILYYDDNGTLLNTERYDKGDTILQEKN